MLLPVIFQVPLSSTVCPEGIFSLEGLGTTAKTGEQKNENKKRYPEPAKHFSFHNRIIYNYNQSVKVKGRGRYYYPPFGGIGDTIQYLSDVPAHPFFY